MTHPTHAHHATPHTATGDTTRPVADRTAQRDRGSVLPFVLVMLVIGSMVVVPLLDYSMTVFRANHAVSELAGEAEAARSGLRTALADPVKLYNDCGNAGLNNGVALALPELEIDTTTTCYLLSVNKARDDFSLPFSQVMTYVGATNIEGPTTQVYGTEYEHSGDVDPELWLDTTSKDGAKDTVWLPDLPVHAITARSSTAFEMPAGYPLNGYTTCDVYFPGTYKQPMTLDGPTYFTSGIYYFESTVTVVGGAQVLAGQGTLDGCADDQYAAFYAVDAPSTHNISGLGATFVLGKSGQLVFDDAAGPIEFRMNQRYVGAGDLNTKSSAMVSIVSVNGALDPALVSSNFANSGINLEVPGRLSVPLSYVDGADGTRPAPVDQYRPTTLTPAPREPEAPIGATAAARNGAVLVSWTAPTQDGGSPITGYTVKYRPASSTAAYTTIGCETTQVLACVVPSLSNGTAYTFVVEAVNAIGRSAQSTATSSVTPQGSSPTIGNPGSATGIKVTEGTPAVAKVSRYVDTLEVSWTAPSAGNGAITRYRVSVTDGSNAWECETQGVTTCVVPVPIPLVSIPLTPLQIAVYSYNRRADGSEGSSSATSSGFYLNALGATYTAPPAPTPTAYAPPPIVDVNLTTANAVDISIPGYIAVPQSVVRVAATNPANKSVSLAGGVLAAWSVVDADVADRPADFEFGLMNPATQRVVRLVTVVDGSRYRGEAVVQVNETGAWAVNNWFVQ